MPRIWVNIPLGALEECPRCGFRGVVMLNVKRNGISGRVYPARELFVRHRFRVKAGDPASRWRGFRRKGGYWVRRLCYTGRLEFPSLYITFSREIADPPFERARVESGDVSP